MAKQTTFTITFSDGETASLSAEYKSPEFKKGWWSYDTHGKEVYEKNSDRKPRELGTKMYFHVEVENITVGSEIEMQLYDYDHIMWAGFATPDTDEFPNDPVTKKGYVKLVNGKHIVSVGVDLRNSWEPVIKDDHDDGFNVLDRNIELYWTLKYVDKKGHTKKVILPKKIENYLLVSYSKQDLFILPAAGANKGLPEIYDRTGNLIVFAIKSANYLITATGGSGTIEHFIATKIRIVKNTQLLANINAVKKEIFYEQIDLVTNNSKKLSYEVIEASNFKIKNNIKYVDVEEITSKTAKKFSDYLNQRDLSNLGFKGIQVARKVLKVLDFIEMTETIKSILPKDNSSTLNIPNPAGVIGAFSSFASVAAYPIAALFFTADIVATEMVKGLMNDIKEDGKLFLAQAKLKGLAAVKQYLKTDSAKICGYDIEENIPQKTHEQFIKGNINNLQKLQKSKFDESLNLDNISGSIFYSYIYQIVEDPNREVDIYTINTIIIQ